MHFRTSTRKGFTIIELLLTIGLITLLSGAVLTAMASSKNEAKNVKVKTEIKQVERSLQSHDVGVGGYPNPEPGQKKLYCIGSTDCMLEGKAVTTYLNPINGQTSLVGDGQDYRISDLISFGTTEGETRGYMYLSCGDPGPTCDSPDSINLIYGQTSGTLYESLNSNSVPAPYDAHLLEVIAGSFQVGTPDLSDPYEYGVCTTEFAQDFSTWERFDFFQSTEENPGWCETPGAYYIHHNPSSFICVDSENPPAYAMYSLSAWGECWLIVE